MAKKKFEKIKLVSTAGTGYCYYAKKSVKGGTTDKLEFSKYDPVVKKHVLFKEHKI